MSRWERIGEVVMFVLFGIVCIGGGLMLADVVNSLHKIANQ